MRLVGGLVEKARAGGVLPERHYNPYLEQAAGLADLLLTPGELASALADGVVSLFPQEGHGSEQRPGPYEASPLSPRLFVEVGSYLGKNLVEMSQAHPEHRFVGLDITYKRTVRTAKKIRSLGLANARVGLCDARMFFGEMAPQAVAGVCIFFPDPWPKLRQAKNRLLQGPFFEQLKRALRPDGFVWIKTDAAAYFASALEESSPYFVLDQSSAVPHEFGGLDFVTVFEELFRRQGQPFQSGVLRLRGEQESSRAP